MDKYGCILKMTFTAVARLLLLALIVLAGFLGSEIADAQSSGADPSGKVVYKTVGNISLNLWFYDPVNPSAGTSRPAVIFFHGGSWRNGSPKQFSGQVHYLASLGMVAVSAEYRVSETHGTTPLEAVLDAKSAIRWLRANAGKLHIDPNRIAAAGGSAGGHLALSAAIADDVNDASDDLLVSARPNALVLFNPVVSLGKGGLNIWGRDFSKISPLHRLNDPLPPTIIMHGTDDRIVPYAEVQDFVSRARSTGSKDISVMAYEGRNHGFFNQRDPNRDDYAATLSEMVRFLGKIGWMQTGAVDGKGADK